MRRLTLSRKFGIRVAVGHSVGPLVAGAAGVAALAGALAAAHRLPELAAGAIAAAAGTIVYLIVLKLWLSLKSESLALSHFVVEPSEPEVAPQTSDFTSNKAIDTR
jgi:hypothetical protein